MNLYQLRDLIKHIEANTPNDIELIEFYKRKERELLRAIKKSVEFQLLKVEPIILKKDFDNLQSQVTTLMV